MHNQIITVLMAILATGLTCSAQTNTESHGPCNDRAGPLFGMSITIGSNTTDTVILSHVSFRHTDRHTGLGTATAYLHLYDAFATDTQYKPSIIGHLVAVSANTIDFSKAEPDSLLTWNFDKVELDPTKTYHYIFSTDTQAATTDDHSNLTTSAFRLDTGNPYPGGQVWRASSPWGSPSTGWDMEFELAWTPKPEPLPAPSTPVSPLKKFPAISPVIIIGGIGLLLIRGKCKR